MDLIERDEVMHEIGKLSLAWEYGQAVKDCYEIVKKAPTVEAIPVEYIESTMNRWKEIIGYEESVDALRILIDNWKIERKEEC